MKRRARPLKGKSTLQRVLLGNNGYWRRLSSERRRTMLLEEALLRAQAHDTVDRVGSAMRGGMEVTHLQLA